MASPENKEAATATGAIRHKKGMRNRLTVCTSGGVNRVHATGTKLKVTSIEAKANRI
ncbi:hypothetical protein MGWOODY_Tha2952 [hydrothermal vent metagenome]|uniref:Uncharacterized protein n=1 Tax=hydrothermal vent metagenome TaxID=652676 RepID=A0A160TFA3_9ZZZZ